MASGMVAMVSGPQHEVQHLNPVWRDKSNFIIGADIQPSEGDASLREQLWAYQIDECHFEVCCIPFFVYNLALGDLVETAPSAGRKYMIRRVVKPSGRYVFRAWFGESSADRDEIAAALESREALLEWSSRNLLAVDACDASHATEIATFLQEQEDAGRLMYETGKTA